MPTFGNQPRASDRRRRGLRARRMTLDPTFPASLGAFSARASRKNFGARASGIVGGAGVAGVGAAGVAGYGSEGLGAQMEAIERFMRNTVEWGRRVAEKVNSFEIDPETGLNFASNQVAITAGTIASFDLVLPDSPTGYWWANHNIKVVTDDSTANATFVAGDLIGGSFPVMPDTLSLESAWDFIGITYCRGLSENGTTIPVDFWSDPAIDGELSVISVLEPLMTPFPT